MHMFTRRAALAGAASVLAMPSLAARRTTEVDVKLVLALDVSNSVKPPRWEVQRKGYAAAFANPEIQDAMLSGVIGSIAVAVVQWSEPDRQETMIPWTRIDSREMAGIVSSILAVMPRKIRGGTGIGGAIQYGAQLLENAPYEARRSVIDISGDGEEFTMDQIIRKEGPTPVDVLRGEALARIPNLTINGLALGGAENVEFKELIAFYEHHVIGGPRCFVEPVEDASRLDLLQRGLERKLAKEVVS